MPSRVGVNLRASAYLHQGDRKYMEDEFVVAYQRTADKKDIEYAFFGIFDGHGGKEAAHFAKDHLMDNIVSHRCFWSDDDEDVLEAIRDGFIQTHMAMWKVLEHWPRTASGWPSTSGSTASVAFIRKQKIYIGHVGDSGICLGYESQDVSRQAWYGRHLTKDHKPESVKEKSRITRCGGKVVNKSGVPRVVWNRPKRGHKGPVRRSTPMDEIPFLAVARSLGDLWSYNPTNNQFVVSPVPDVHVHPIDIANHRCLIFGTDGLWNVMSPSFAVNIAYSTEKNNEDHYLGVLMPCGTKPVWANPARAVVKGALDRYVSCYIRADNTSAVVVFLDPPGRPKREVLLQRKGLALSPSPPKNLNVETTKDNQSEGSSSSNSNSQNQNSSTIDSKISVHVYSLDDKHSKNCPKVSAHGVLRIKERMPEKWQMDKPETNDQCSPSDVSSVEGITPIAKAIPQRIAGDTAEQASTPGSTDENLRHLASSLSSPSLASSAASLAASLSNLSNRTPTSQFCPISSVSSPQLSSHPSIRSTLRSSGADISSPNAASQSTRLSLCTGTPGAGRKSVTTHRRAGTSSDATPGAADAVSSKSLKRDREDDSSSTQSTAQSKKNCAECCCGAVHTTKSVSSVMQMETRDRTSNVDKRSNIPSASCASCHGVSSSQKSPKLKVAHDVLSKTHKKGDIQIAVVSSSTLVTSDCRSSITATITAVPPSMKIGNQLKKTMRYSPGSVGVKRNRSDNRRTRSRINRSSNAIQPENKNPSAHSALHNNNIWNSDNKAGTSRLVARSSDNVAVESGKIADKLGSPLARTDSAQSRVLKSVNRGSPNENIHLSLKNDDSVMKVLKTSKYAKMDRQKKRGHSTPCMPVSSDAIAPPPKKKSAKMHLRSGKPMITRSQEKTCKTARPK